MVPSVSAKHLLPTTPARARQHLLYAITLLGGIACPEGLQETVLAAYFPWTSSANVPWDPSLSFAKHLLYVFEN